MACARFLLLLFVAALGLALAPPGGHLVDAHAGRGGIIPTGGLQAGRSFHTASPLANGNVIVVGGIAESG